MFQMVYILNVRHCAQSRMSHDHSRLLSSVKYWIQHSLESRRYLEHSRLYSVNILQSLECSMNILESHSRYINSLYSVNTLVHSLPIKCRNLLLVFQLTESQKQQGYLYYPFWCLKFTKLSPSTNRRSNQTRIKRKQRFGYLNK